jgi:uncharacterized Zn-binding protein involved in type VI secretion
MVKRPPFFSFFVASVTVLFLLVSNGACEEEFFNNWNIAGVYNGGSNPTVTIKEPAKITTIQTYHWNNARGTAPGTVGLRASDGKMYGPWQASGTPGQGGVPNANWIVKPNVVLPAGTYTVVDSNPGTWSQNGGSGGKGFVFVRGEPATEEGKIEVELTYPLGASPKVFTKGWILGAKCIAKGPKGEQDLSGRVRWSGSATFHPATGSKSHPAFNSPGQNSITLTCALGKETATRTFQIETVSTDKYAHLGDFAFSPADSHGCPADPHQVQGPIIAGSALVLIDGKPAARKGDPGVHAACCGANTFTIADGDPDVLIEGRPAARIGDATAHCGGMGTIIGAPKPLPPVSEWNEQHWKDLGAKYRNRETSPEEKAEIREKLRVEKTRLTMLREAVPIPANWREVHDPAARQYIQKLQQQEREIKRRINVVESAF